MKRFMLCVSDVTMSFCRVVDYEWTIRDVAWPRASDCEELKQSTLYVAAVLMLRTSS
jgi:hypothetical protein